jgi:hypothetical protein
LRRLLKVCFIATKKFRFCFIEAKKVHLEVNKKSDSLKQQKCTKVAERQNICSKRFIIVKILVVGAPPASSQLWLAPLLTVGSIVVGCWLHYRLSFAAPPPQDGSNTGQRW